MKHFLDRKTSLTNISIIEKKKKPSLKSDKQTDTLGFYNETDRRKRSKSRSGSGEKKPFAAGGYRRRIYPWRVNRNIRSVTSYQLWPLAHRRSEARTIDKRNCISQIYHRWKILHSNAFYLRQDVACIQIFYLMENVGSQLWNKTCDVVIFTIGERFLRFFF